MHHVERLPAQEPEQRHGSRGERKRRDGNDTTRTPSRSSASTISGSLWRNVMIVSSTSEWATVSANSSWRRSAPPDTCNASMICAIRISRSRLRLAGVGLLEAPEQLFAQIRDVDRKRDRVTQRNRSRRYATDRETLRARASRKLVHTAQHAQRIGDQLLVATRHTSLRSSSERSKNNMLRAHQNSAAASRGSSIPRIDRGRRSARGPTRPQSASPGRPPRCCGDS